jgi:uncharacterized protein DUF4105
VILYRLPRWIGHTLLAIAILLSGGWCSLAIWFRCSTGEPVHSVLAGVIVIAALGTVLCLATPRRRLAVTIYSASVAFVIAWWSTITPSNDRDWAPDVARTVTATIDGDRLVVSNVRNFNWRSDTDFDQRWEQRTYSLSRVNDVDLILSYWAGEAIAHLIISFGFDDGARLTFRLRRAKSAVRSIPRSPGSSSSMSW